MLRILTDRGTEYCGRVEHHDYQLYLAIDNIDHTKTKAIFNSSHDFTRRHIRWRRVQVYAHDHDSQHLSVGITAGVFLHDITA